jgi:Ion channel
MEPNEPQPAPQPDDGDVGEAIDLRAEWRARHEGTTFRQRLDRPDRYGVLLILIMASLISIAVFNDGDAERAVSIAVLGVTVVFALRTSRAPRRFFHVAIASVPLIVIVSVFVARGEDSQAAREAIAVITFVLLMAVFIAIIGRMAVHLTISMATVLAGLCIYLLIGLVFSTIYNFMDASDSTPLFAQVQTASASDTLYFSFITMTTVGYGDLTPVGNLPRMTAATEALTGQIYLVTAVALLVGNLGRQRRRRTSR